MTWKSRERTREQGMRTARRVVIDPPTVASKLFFLQSTHQCRLCNTHLIRTPSPHIPSTVPTDPFYDFRPNTTCRGSLKLIQYISLLGATDRTRCSDTSSSMRLPRASSTLCKEKKAIIVTCKFHHQLARDNALFGCPPRLPQGLESV